MLRRIGPINPTHGVPPQGHLQGQTRDNKSTRFFHTKKEHRYMCSYIVSVVYMQNCILFKGIHFVLSYCTQRWNAYVATTAQTTLLILEMFPFMILTGPCGPSYNKPRERLVYSSTFWILCSTLLTKQNLFCS